MRPCRFERPGNLTLRKNMDLRSSYFEDRIREHFLLCCGGLPTVPQQLAEAIVKMDRRRSAGSYKSR